jgi:glycosyltransferase involved in cell wall biosynthesis
LLDALLKGTMADFEVVIVDGQSTDGTRQIIFSLAERDPRVRLLDNPQRTTPAALNLGIAEARGEVIAILGLLVLGRKKSAQCDPGN